MTLDRPPRTPAGALKDPVRPAILAEATAAGYKPRLPGLGMQFGTAYVVASTTAALRARAFALLADQAVHGTPRSQYLATDLLGEALQPPSPPGRAAPHEQIDQWHDEELRLVAIAAELLEHGPPLARMELRQRLSWYVDIHRWPDVAEAAHAAIQARVDAVERMLTVFAHPHELGDGWETAQREIAAYASELTSDPVRDDELASRVNDAVKQLDATDALHASPWPVLHRIAAENPERGAAIARWAVRRPGAPLSRFVSSLLGPLRTALPDQLDVLLDALDSDDVRLRRMLADYLSAGSWYSDPHQSDIDRMRRLLTDDDPTIRSTVVQALPALGTTNPALACQLALIVDTTDGNHADHVDHVLSDAVEHLDDAQLERRLQALAREMRLAWSSWQLLAKVGKTRPQRVLDLLLTRARSDASAMRPVYEPRRDNDVLSGFGDDEYRDALRAVGEQALSLNGLPRQNTGKLFWALDRDADISLDVLGECLMDTKFERVRAAAHLLDPLALALDVPGEDYDGGWHLMLSHADLVNTWLRTASRNGSEHGQTVRDALMMIMTSGMTGRGMGTAAKRHLTTRETARALAAHSPAGSIDRVFWTAVAAHADREIAEDELEDEEFGEDVH